MRDTPREFRALGTVAIQAADGEGKLPRFEGVAYTGAPMKPDGWWQPIIVDLQGVTVPSQHRPALRQHDPQQIVGHTESVAVTTKGIEIAGVFSGEPQHTAKVVHPARNGFQWQLSIGANPKRTEYLEAGETTTVNGREVTGPMTISRETEIGEISFVPLGADGDTSAKVTAQKGQSMNKSDWSAAQLSLSEYAADLVKAGKKCRYSDEDIDKMDKDQARSALRKEMAAAAEEDEKEKDAEKKEEKEKKADGAAQQRLIMAEVEKGIQAAREKYAGELERQSEIERRVKAHGVTTVTIDDREVNLAAHAIKAGWSADQAELLALRAARPGPGVGVPGGLGYSVAPAQVNEAVLEAAVLQAARHQYCLEDDSFWTEPTPDGKSTRVRFGVQKIRADIQRAIKGRYTDQVQQGAHDLFKGRIGLQQLLSTVFAANGVRPDWDYRSEGGIRAMLRAWDQLPIRAEGTSNASISNILANVLNKFALQGYLFTEQVWREIAGIRPVSDFKPVKSINLLGDVMFKAIGPTGEINNASISDQAFANQAQPFARIMTIPWTHIVNDDLGMLTGIPMKLGQGAGLALNDYFWSLWTALTNGSVASAGSAGNFWGTLSASQSVNGDDGNAFWRTSSSLTKTAMQGGTAYNKNKLTGAGSAVQLSALNSARAAFWNQVDPNGNPLGYDGLQPIILYGPSNYQSWMQLLYAGTLVYGGSTSGAATPNYQPFQGSFRPIESRYIENVNYVNSTTAWWMLFNPVALPVIEVCFLNGVDTPAVLTASPDYQFDKLGISVRGVMPFGANQQNFRGGVYNAGA